MKYMSIFGILGCVLLLCLCGCRGTNSLERSLRLAGDNRAELEKVLEYYHQNPQDSLKYRAACFLIANMCWHSNYEDSTTCAYELQPFLQSTDSLYDWYTGNYKKYKTVRDSIREALRNSGIKSKIFLQFAIPDLVNITADFLIRHIDHSVERWQTSPYARRLSFADFCEYILPYKAMPDGWSIPGEAVYDLLGTRMSECDTCREMKEVVQRYYTSLFMIKQVIRNSFHCESLGWQDILFKQQVDCLDDCEFKVQAMRACGIPAALVTCVSNREFIGQHYYCTLLDTIGRRLIAESGVSYLGEKYWHNALNYRLNAFQFMYGAQEDSPYMLRRKGVQLPLGFRLPTIKEVTPDIRETVPMKLPVPESMNNRLVWLYTYSREQGVIAVTWGVVDEEIQEARFKYVIPGVVYFPAYLDEEGSPCFWEEPLFVTKEGGEGRWVKVMDLVKDGKQENVVLTRKFPRKPAMLSLADEMVGSKFYGANRRDGSDRVELFCITERPEDCLNEYRLQGDKSFRYYIFEPANGRSEASVLEFLADKSRGYINVVEASPRQVFSPEDTLTEERAWMKLLPDVSDSGKEFDGDVQTSSGRDRVVFELKRPQVVDCIRLVPKNAENILYPGEDCELFYWDKGWKSYAKMKCLYNYLEFKQLPTDRLYWLKNHSRGKEEVPFLIIDGRQQFLYYDIFKECGV